MYSFPLSLIKILLHRGAIVTKRFQKDMTAASYVSDFDHNRHKVFRKSRKGFYNLIVPTEEVTHPTWLC